MTWRGVKCWQTLVRPDLAVEATAFIIKYDYDAFLAARAGTLGNTLNCLINPEGPGWGQPPDGAWFVSHRSQYRKWVREGPPIPLIALDSADHDTVLACIHRRGGELRV